MSQENVEIVKRGYQASGMTSSLCSLRSCAPAEVAADFVLHPTSEAAPDFGVLDGRDPELSQMLARLHWRPSTSSGSRSRR